MNKLETVTHKYQLVESQEYDSIRQYQLEHIIRLSDSAIDPVLLKGMLKLVHDTNSWSYDFQREKERINKCH